MENAVEAVTSMAGSLAEPILRLDNNGTGPALDLQVESGKAPLTVSSTAGTATNLSADKLDGKDSSGFWSGKRYFVTNSKQGPAGGTVGQFAQCDFGDEVISGGGSRGTSQSLDPVTISEPGIGGLPRWFVNVTDNGAPNRLDVVVGCADFPPLR